jgi:hypothetical protein
MYKKRIVMYLALHGCLSNLAECEFPWLGVLDKDQGAALGHVHQIRKNVKSFEVFLFRFIVSHRRLVCGYSAAQHR